MCFRKVALAVAVAHIGDPCAERDFSVSDGFDVVAGDGGGAGSRNEVSQCCDVGFPLVFVDHVCDFSQPR